MRGGRVVGYRHKLLEVTAENYRPDRKIKRLVAEIRRPFARRLDETIGRTDTDLFRKGVLESSMDNFIADAVREATGADIGMANGFRFSYPITKGAITEESLFNIFPMEANIKVGTLTGKQLRNFWENSLEDVFAADAYGQRGGWGARPSGMNVRVRLGAPKGARILWMKIGGELVKDDKHLHRRLVRPSGRRGGDALPFRGREQQPRAFNHRSRCDAGIPSPTQNN
ncbi:MAG TPA: 5'-nucleotidase [Pyrinomonadaceae bacterium]|nr:5'-nucleotidase [Pyrinomonadaceae bacterium]